MMRILFCATLVVAVANANVLPTMPALRGGAAAVDLGLPPKHVLERGGYTPVLKDKVKLEDALTDIKRLFEDKLKKEVNLMKVSAP
eukprot:1191812-Rhodomonas_salina.1